MVLVFLALRAALVAKTGKAMYVGNCTPARVTLSWETQAVPKFLLKDKQPETQQQMTNSQDSAGRRKGHSVIHTFPSRHSQVSGSLSCDLHSSGGQAWPQQQVSHRVWARQDPDQTHTAQLAEGPSSHSPHTVCFLYQPHLSFLQVPLVLCSSVVG